MRSDAVTPRHRRTPALEGSWPPSRRVGREPPGAGARQHRWTRRRPAPIGRGGSLRPV